MPSSCRSAAPMAQRSSASTNSTENSWKSGNDEAAYSSPQVATLAGVEQAILFTADALMGVDGQAESNSGAVPLKTFAKRHAATPVVSGDKVFVNSTTIGLVCEKISMKGEALGSQPNFGRTRICKINFRRRRSSAIFLQPGPAKNFVCVDAKTGALKWAQPGWETKLRDDCVRRQASHSDRRWRAGFDRGEPGKIHGVGSRAGLWQELEFSAYSDGKIYVRDTHELACLQIRNKNGELPGASSDAGAR